MEQSTATLKRPREKNGLDVLEETWLFLPNQERLFLPRVEKTSHDGHRHFLEDEDLHEAQPVDEYIQENYPCLIEQNRKFQSTTSSHIFLDHTSSKSEGDAEIQTSTRDSNGEGSFPKFLNVCEGEMAHATPCQADAVGSSDATTCHVLAIRSTASNESLCNNLSHAAGELTKKSTDVEGKDHHSPPLVTVAHINRSSCSESLNDIVRHHLRFHRVVDGEYLNLNHDRDEEGKGVETTINVAEPSRKRAKFSSKDMEAEIQSSHKKPVQFEIHLAGGFVDERGISQNMSSFIIRELSALARRYKEVAQMSLLTCALSCMNTAVQTSSLLQQEDLIRFLSNDLVMEPIARGLYICTKSGKVHVLNSVPPPLQGPAPELRQARLWGDTYSDELTLIHDSCREHSFLESDDIRYKHDCRASLKSKITIEPFEYHFSSRYRRYLALKSDTELLQKTSTSPHCEGNDFCESIRRTFRYMRNTPCESVFGPFLNQRVEYNW